MSRQLSSVQIHVERVICRIKKFRLLQTTLPLTQLDLLDDIMVIVCGLVNIIIVQFHFESTLVFFSS